MNRIPCVTLGTLRGNNRCTMRTPLHLLTPHWRAGTVTEIRLELLRRLGIRALLLDLDNTLLAFRSPRVAADVEQWLVAARDAGFRLCLVSNARPARLQVHADQLGIPMVGGAQKPRRRALRRAMTMLRVEPAETAMIGDQVFADVLVGNRLGLYTILVTPLSARDGWLWMPWVRGVERWLSHRTPSRNAH